VGSIIPPRFFYCGYCYLVFLQLINLNKKACLYSDRTFQVANRKFFLRLLLVFIVLICLIFSSFSFVLSVFSVDGNEPIAQPLDAGGSRTGGHPSGIQSYRCSQSPHQDQSLCVAFLWKSDVTISLSFISR
jgi:hypothetical protein